MDVPDWSDQFHDEALALLVFGRLSRSPHGFGWLTDEGTLDPSMGTRLWITGRMTHCFALGHLLGVAGCDDLTEHGVRSLTSGPLRDRSDAGWHSTVDADGSPVVDAKSSYDSSFVILAASSAKAAGVAGAQRLLDDALSSFDELWWDDESGMVVDVRHPHEGEIDPYRGANANMHTVEALLAALAATGDRLHLDRALRITRRVAHEFERHGLRLPEHFDSSWVPLLDYNRDVPADAFRPYGSTIGHWLEWSRLMLEVRAELELRHLPVPDFLDVFPQHMYRKALADGWGPDGRPGFVYTVDFEGLPVVRHRMHWVLCEAIGAAASLSTATGDPSYAYDIDGYWAYAKKYLIEQPGQWVEELDPINAPTTGTWSGKPDIYHALQAMLVSSLPLAPSFAWALREVSG